MRVSAILHPTLFILLHQPVLLSAALERGHGPKGPRGQAVPNRSHRGKMRQSSGQRRGGDRRAWRVSGGRDRKGGMITSA